MFLNKELQKSAEEAFAGMANGEIFAKFICDGATFFVVNKNDLPKVEHNQTFGEFVSNEKTVVIYR